MKEAGTELRSPHEEHLDALLLLEINERENAIELQGQHHSVLTAWQMA